MSRVARSRMAAARRGSRGLCRRGRIRPVSLSFLHVHPSAQISFLLFRRYNGAATIKCANYWQSDPVLSADVCIRYHFNSPASYVNFISHAPRPVSRVTAKRNRSTVPRRRPATDTGLVSIPPPAAAAATPSSK